MRLTPEQIGVVIYEVGGWGPGGPTRDGGDSVKRDKVEKWLDIAIAVAYGESSFDTAAKNGNAQGLYQIMTSVHGDKIAAAIQRWSAEFNKEVTIFNPYVNVDVARMVYQEAASAGRDPWSPWEVYTEKTAGYRSGLGHGKEVYEFLHSEDRIRQASKELRAEIKLGKELGAMASAVIPGGGLLNAAGGMGDMLGTVLEFLKDSGIAIGAFLLAVILLILGIWFLLSNRVKDTVKKVSPVA